MSGSAFAHQSSVNGLSDLGLSIVGCHINPLQLDILPRALDYQAELGNRQIGCDIEFYPLGDRDYVLRRCDAFNRVGELARERGMRFYYHNHFQEFQRLGDDYVYDIILANTDPDLVLLEFDTYWVYRGGQDPHRVDAPATPTVSSCCIRRTFPPTRPSRSTSTTEWSTPGRTST